MKQPQHMITLLFVLSASIENSSAKLKRQNNRRTSSLPLIIDHIDNEVDISGGILKTNDDNINTIGSNVQGKRILLNDADDERGLQIDGSNLPDLDGDKIAGIIVDTVIEALPEIDEINIVDTAIEALTRFKTGRSKKGKGGKGNDHHHHDDYDYGEYGHYHEDGKVVYNGDGEDGDGDAEEKDTDHESNSIDDDTYVWSDDNNCETCFQDPGYLGSEQFHNMQTFINPDKITKRSNNFFVLFTNTHRVIEAAKGDQSRLTTSQVAVGSLYSSNGQTVGFYKNQRTILFTDADGTATDQSKTNLITELFFQHQGKTVATLNIQGDEDPNTEYDAFHYSIISGTGRFSGAAGTLSVEERGLTVPLNCDPTDVDFTSRNDNRCVDFVLYVTLYQYWEHDYADYENNKCTFCD
eukprot:CAMPEP_0194364466 /NCGR_PEP_ID=MMETSP0174-20130528/12388_1 /TAXON_ID=216777 /ORGANISM="Proboscia alata, Strain PI-D3" /LENGTH=409 /DNA_ID=CAMNT_0039138513 /DNA_START=117 /DNA_END=1346 /DNA_ORIENTATION=-